MIARFLSTRPTGKRTGAVVAMVLGAALMGAQSVGAQVEPTEGELLWAPGSGFDYVEVGGVSPAPVDEHTTVVPALPWIPGEIHPASGDVQPGW